MVIELLLPLEEPEVLVSIDSLVELPIPVPYPGLMCAVCGMWPVRELATRRDSRLSEIVCDHHSGVVATPDFISTWRPQRLEWRGDKWVEVKNFSAPEGASGDYHWRKRHAQIEGS